MKSIVKMLMGKEITQEERAAITMSGHYAIIPKELVNKVIELTKGYNSLKELCDVIPVKKNEGTIPLVDISGQNELLEILEGDAIIEGELVSTEFPFKCAKVGLLQTLSSETVDDAEEEIKNLVKSNFLEISIANENIKILNIIKSNATVIEGGTSYEDVTKAMDTSLPSIKKGLVTFTNVSGYSYLKSLKDSTGRNLDLITIVNGVEMFNGKRIETVEDELLPASALKKVFYIANTKESIKYIDRKQFTLDTSAEAGFMNDTVVVRILKRFDVRKGSTRSIKKIEI